MFGNEFKQYLDCLMYLLNQNKTKAKKQGKNGKSFCKLRSAPYNITVIISYV